LSKGRDIRGLTIEIGGDTTGLQKSLKNVNTEIKTTQAQLKDINNLLKLDPTNTELLQQKQKALADEISSTKEKLEALKTAEQQAQQQFAEGKISQQQYDALKREIIATEESLKSLETEAKNAPTQMQQSIDGLNTKIKTTQTELKEIDKLLKLDPTNTELLQQKQRALSDEIGNTKDKLELLKNEEQEVQQKFQEGKVSQEQYDALKRTIIETEESLKSLENEVGSGSAKLAQISTEAGKIGENLTTAGEKMLPVTAAITGLGTAAVKTAADFDSSMSNVQAISGASAEDMDKLRERAREMGAQTKFSAKEAGDAMGYMAMAGWNVQDMYNSLPGIMNLAAASGEDLATTSDIVTDAMTAFGLAADETTTIVKDGFSKEVDNATHFADVLAKAASSSNTNVSMLGESFKYIAPVAGSLGYSVEDAAVALGLMANSGIKASQGGTALRTMLTNLAKPTDSIADAMDYLNISLSNSDGSMKSLKELMDNLRSSFGQCKMPMEEFQQQLADIEAKYESGDLTEKKYNKALEDLTEKAYGAEGALKAKYAATIAGKEGMSGLLSIINTTDAEYQSLINSIYDADGAAEDMANTMQDNLGGQLTQLKSALEELAIAFGEILMPYIRKAVSVIQDFVKKLNGMSEGQKKIVATIALIVAAIGPLLITIGKVATGISAIAALFSKMKTLTTITSILVKVKGAFTALFGVIAANPVIAVIAAIVAALVLLYTKCEWFRDGVNAVVQKIASFFTETIPQAWSTLMEFLSGVPEWWSGIWQQVSDFFMGIWNGIITFFTVTIPQAWNSIVTFFTDIPAWWSGIWQQVSDFFTNIWTTMMQNPVISGVVTTITTLWQNAVTTLQGIWQGLVAIAQGAWELLKNTILAPVILLIDLVTGNFEKLKTDASNIWTNIQNAAKTIWSGIKQVVSTLAQGLVTAVTTMFTGFKNTLSRIWTAASQAASKAWTSIKNFVVNAAENLKERASDSIQTLKENASEYWDNIRSSTSETWQNVKETVIDYARNMKDSAVETFRSVVSGISSALSGVYSTVVNGFSGAIGYITSLPGQAIRWGQDFVNGIANGIRSCIGNVTSAVSSVANTIRSWLHFSRPDEGPLHYYEDWMPDFMQGLATGIEKSRGLVTDAMKDVQMSLQLDTSSLKDASDPSKTDLAGITGMLTQLIQVMSAGQDIYFDNREWAGKLAPAINNELGRIAKEAAYR
jgi:TP901 family phage tail tape measure protein